jgi:V/A-type H+-transporting ATPase subunit A
MERQKYMLELILGICRTDFEFESFEEVMPYFIKMVNLCKQMNYAEFKSPDFHRFESELNETVAERRVK